LRDMQVNLAVYSKRQDASFRPTLKTDPGAPMADRDRLCITR